MAEIIQGFDDRDWTGFLTPEQVAMWGFVGIKVSQGRVWNPKDRALLQRQWERANDNYGLLRIPFHYLLSPVIGQDPKLYGKQQAENFFTTMEVKNLADVRGWGELPPCIDVEHRRLLMPSGYHLAMNLKTCLDETEAWWDKVPLIYTATWYWDKYMHVEFEKLVPEYWKIYDLWEADPKPDTTIKGWGDTNSVQQYELDFDYAGYPGELDLDETTQAWIDSRSQTVPIPSDCDDEVNEALSKQKIKLEGDHLVELELAKKDAYNFAIGESVQAVLFLSKE